MTKALRVLIVEDSVDDAELLLRALRHGGYEPMHARVETADTMRAELSGHPWDIVLSDFNMPQFDAFDALALLHDTGLDLPFIIVSGTIGEDRAVAAMQAGVQDYILKGNLTRLVPAVERELEQAGQRRARHQADDELRHARAAEARLGRLLDESSDEIHVFDAETLRFVQMNAGARHNLGYAEDELGRMTPVDLQPENTADDIVTLLEPLRTGELDRLRVETVQRRRDGSTYPVEVRLQYVASEDPPVFVAIAQDITERRALESQLLQAQKIEAIGQLAGGIAHDFNNVLTAIRGYSELLRGNLPTGDEQSRADIDQVILAADRAAALTGQLLAFGRRQVLQPRVLEPARLVEDLAPMLRRLLGEHIELTTHIAPGLGRVRVDPSQLEQVVVNLAVNARDAMPDGGQLTFELSNVELDTAYAAAHAEATPGRHVLLAVSDTGSGMDATTQAHIFEPFFTTKKVGQGTGMGLATVYGIVKQSGGSIYVYSESNRGSTFKVYLPRVFEDAAAVLADAVASPQSSGTETILLVEDDPAVRSFSSRTLEGYGYAVLEAATGAEALSIAASHVGPIALLITDVVMPGLQGHQVADLLTAARPELRVLYVSGFTSGSVINHGVPRHGVAFLPKPFSTNELGVTVRRVLDASAG